MNAFRPCAVIPSYDNPHTVAAVVASVRAHVSDVFLIDDGSQIPLTEVLNPRPEGVHIHRRASNGGKGAAVKDGLRLAREQGFSHALQLDADGQHNSADIPKFLAAAKGDPAAFVTGKPSFDDSAPAMRVWARQLSVFWVSVETLSRRIADPLCGFRVYPLNNLPALEKLGNRMDFDPEIAVRLVWRGVPVINIETPVRYLSRAEGGVSHFRGVHDTLLICWLHTRLVLSLLGSTLLRPFRSARS
jgi:glycosyltransferase involved in cell wall biosynthesis